MTKQEADEATSQVSTSDDQVSESGLYVDILPEGEASLYSELNQVSLVYTMTVVSLSSVYLLLNVLEVRLLLHFILVVLYSFM